MTYQKDNGRTINPGAMLVGESALLPEPVAQDSHSMGNGWACITNNAAFENKVAAAGWAFFYMAGTMRARVFGFDHQRMIQNAVKQLLASAVLQKCNCLEIDQIVTGSFCGVPSVTVLAHSRHIQPQHSFYSAIA